MHLALETLEVCTKTFFRSKKCPTLATPYYVHNYKYVLYSKSQVEILHVCILGNYIVLKHGFKVESL